MSMPTETHSSTPEVLVRKLNIAATVFLFLVAFRVLAAEFAGEVSPREAGERLGRLTVAGLLVLVPTRRRFSPSDVPA